MCCNIIKTLPFFLLLGHAAAFTIQTTLGAQKNAPALFWRESKSNNYYQRRKGGIPVLASAAAANNENKQSNSNNNVDDLSSDLKANGDDVFVKDAFEEEEDDDDNDDDDSRLDMPWSNFHDWALRDNLPRYIRILPGKKPRTYALWRTMMQDVPELSGYPIEFLQKKYAAKPRQQRKESNGTTKDDDDDDDTTAETKKTQRVASSKPGTVPEVLPYLDNFCFENAGGLSGQVRWCGGSS